MIIKRIYLELFFDESDFLDLKALKNPPERVRGEGALFFYSQPNPLAIRPDKTRAVVMITPNKNRKLEYILHTLNVGDIMNSGNFQEDVK